ncbi:Glycerol-3-phosphate cytidylyltransferase [Desulfocapsa sulfexigens DSM 10523]|uniref:Glycerol-3-phosphate cytidylyltransferase n=1 Tax=Desulfocapsa sulfexigens (strain DSM 10523 / SB164P1) TaxID=1167006 RepID=M1PQX1_DESSD|nr:glycerol-3-phosphate cytidylyltransferase [Desulfocapsa sulfexigens]AGF78796.1 Glycerol-3-phosphate cytidylyltransferase [Desulfocapsa sulfexigens DSM 10523]
MMSIDANIKTILTYGTFDFLHVGHIRLLKRAKALGDFLIVGLSADDFNLLKHKSSFLPFDQRKEILEAICYVDLVIPEKSWDQKIKDVLHYKVDIFVMGDDWKGEFDFLKEYCEVIYLPRTKDISSSSLKGQLRNGG